MFTEQPRFENKIELSRELTELGRALADPFMEDVYQDIRLYNEMFRVSVPSEEERLRVQAEFDGKWGSLMDAPAVMTGTVRALNPEGEAESYFIDDIQAISKGFAVVLEPVVHDGEMIDEVAVIKHCVHLAASDVWGPSKEGEGSTDNIILIATAEIDKCIMEFKQVSFERAHAWLNTYHSELVDEIDSRILNTSGGEDEAILSLRGLDINSFSEEPLDEITRSCLQVYLNEIIEIDTNGPYGAILNGRALFPGEEGIGKVLRVESNKVLLRPVRLAVMKEFKRSSATKDRWEIALDGFIMPNNRLEEMERIFMSMKSVRSLQSIRAIFYANAENNN